MSSHAEHNARTKKVLTQGVSQDLKGHLGKINDVKWHRDGKKLITGAVDSSIRGWDMMKMKGDTFSGHTAPVESLCWSPREDVFASASSDRTIKLWDSRTFKKPFQNMKTQGENINIAWSPDGYTVAFANQDDLVTFIDVRKNYSAFKKQKYKSRVNQITWNNDGNLFCVAADDVYCYDHKAGNYTNPIHIVHYPTGYCKSISFDRTGRYMAIGGSDSLMTIWDADELAPIKAMQRSSFPIRSVSFNFDGTLVSGGSESSRLEMCHPETGELVHHLESAGPIHAVDWHPSKNIVAYGGEERPRNSSDPPKALLRVFGQKV